MHTKWLPPGQPFPISLYFPASSTAAFIFFTYSATYGTQSSPYFATIFTIADPTIAPSERDAISFACSGSAIPKPTAQGISVTSLTFSIISPILVVICFLTPVTPREDTRDFLAWGYFQSARYFDDFADEIKAELRPKAAPAGELAAAIAAAAYPAAVHLRRGDYCRPENEILQVCTPAYYARAAAAVKAAHPDATLFVFSDDVDWAKQNLNTADLPAVFAPRGSAVGDMALMEQCRGFVLSNSTYSWWAQYLAKTSDKLVLAPEKWYAHTKKSALYLPDWQLIETD